MKRIADAAEPELQRQKLLIGTQTNNLCFLSNQSAASGLR
jgi:hypothetical protein